LWWIYSLSLSLSCWILLWKRTASRILYYARKRLAVLCVRLSNREAASSLWLFLWSFTLCCEPSVPIKKIPKKILSHSLFYFPVCPMTSFYLVLIIMLLPLSWVNCWCLLFLVVRSVLTILQES
jgi:hypothetical protein